MTILRIKTAEVCGPHHLRLAFSDGTAGIADVTSLLQGPIFEPLLKADYFRSGKLDGVSGTIAWPNGADFAPEALKAVTQ